MVERRATRVTLVSSHRFLTVNYDQYYTFLPLFAQPLPKPPPCTNDAKTLAFFLKTPIKAKGRTCNSPPLSPRPRLSPSVACFITFFFWFFFSHFIIMVILHRSRRHRRRRRRRRHRHSKNCCRRAATITTAITVPTYVSSSSIVN